MNETIELVLFVYGLGAVIALGAAVLIKLIVVALAWADRPQAQPQLQPVATPARPAVEDGVPAHHLVAIAAAAHALFGAHRIVHIGAARSGAGWAAEGRFAHHGSHNISHHH
ncbi:MAG: hypothetical protein LDL39_09175 [Magnetospirillum sp.]|nr:hypothetical protein [Magnetospirillum sp.]